MSDATQGAASAAKKNRAEFFQGLVIKIGFVALLAMLGKAPMLLAMSTWFLTYAVVSIGFGLVLRQMPCGQRLNYWDEAAIFLLLTLLARFASGLATGAEPVLPG